MNQADIIDLYVREALAVHASCDECGIPRTHDGSPLSMSQRVAMLVVHYESWIRTNVAVKKAQQA